jgi:hypothetical protein
MYMDIYLENRRHPQAILIRIDWRVNRVFLGQRGIFKRYFMLLLYHRSRAYQIQGKTPKIAQPVTYHEECIHHAGMSHHQSQSHQQGPEECSRDEVHGVSFGYVKNNQFLIEI